MVRVSPGLYRTAPVSAPSPRTAENTEDRRCAQSADKLASHLLGGPRDQSVSASLGFQHFDLPTGECMFLKSLGKCAACIEADPGAIIGVPKLIKARAMLTARSRREFRVGGSRWHRGRARRSDRPAAARRFAWSPPPVGCSWLASPNRKQGTGSSDRGHRSWYPGVIGVWGAHRASRACSTSSPSCGTQPPPAWSAARRRRPRRRPAPPTAPARATCRLACPSPGT